MKNRLDEPRIVTAIASPYQVAWTCACFNLQNILYSANRNKPEIKRPGIAPAIGVTIQGSRQEMDSFDACSKHEKFSCFEQISNESS
jgi:hypothetical protein